MKKSDLKQLRTKSPPMKPLEQIGFDNQNCYICPFCCTELARIIRNLPDECPVCGQRIDKAIKQYT